MKFHAFPRAMPGGVKLNKPAYPAEMGFEKTDHQQRRYATYPGAFHATSTPYNERCGAGEQCELVTFTGDPRAPEFEAMHLRNRMESRC